MANRPGIVWGRTGSPDDLIVALSALPNQLDGIVEQVMKKMLEEAVKEVKESISTRGVHRGIPNNEGRLQTRQMLNSVTYTLTYNRRGRVEGKFGYLRKAPKWALWQEYGTEGGQGNGQGILAMLALTDAYQEFRTNVEDALAMGVRNLKLGQYSTRINSVY